MKLCCDETVLKLKKSKSFSSIAKKALKKFEHFSASQHLEGAYTKKEEEEKEETVKVAKRQV